MSDNSSINDPYKSMDRFSSESFRVPLKPMSALARRQASAGGASHSRSSIGVLHLAGGIPTSGTIIDKHPNSNSTLNKYSDRSLSLVAQ